MLHIEVEREEDGRWIAEVMECPGAIQYGNTIQEAVTKALKVADLELHQLRTG